MPSNWFPSLHSVVLVCVQCAQGFSSHSLAWIFCSLGFLHVCLSTINDCPSMCLCISRFELNCSGQNLTAVPAISPGNDIHQISLSFNHLSLLVNYSFQNMKSLKVLHLDYSYLEMVETSTFHGLYDLETLNLQGNLLETLEPSLFQDLFKLRALDLSSNELTALHLQLFQTLHQLQSLDLCKNKIHSIDNDTFLPLAQLQLLNLAQNPIIGIDPTTFHPLPQLLTLNLSQIGVSSLGSTLFQKLSNLNSLDLSNNLLTTVDASSVEHLNSMKYFNLSRNPLHCNCKMIPLRNWTSSHTEIMWTSQNAAICSEPRWLLGEAFHTIPLSNFTCENQGHDRKPSKDKQKVVEKLPYNKMMGWYTAATLSGMLVLFLLCVVLDKLKRRFFRWRRARRDRMEKYKFKDVPSHQNSIRGPRNSIDCMDSISIVVTQSYLDDPPQTVINSIPNPDYEPKILITNQRNPDTTEATDDKEHDGPTARENKAFSINGPSTSFTDAKPKPWKKHRLSSQEKQQLETSI